MSDTGVNVERGSLAYGTIAARNVGPSTCTITGYPGLKLTYRGKPVATTLAKAQGQSPRPVTLRPGQSASFGFGHKLYNGGHCDAISGARIYDPNGSGYQTTETAFTECEGIAATGPLPVPIEVGPFRSGTKAMLASPVVCAITQLSISDTGVNQKLHGLAYGIIAARNIGSHFCTITGYPGFTLTDQGEPVPTTLTRDKGNPPHTVVLGRGQSASFGFGHKIYDGGHCDMIDGARTYDPDGSGYKTTDTAFSECEGLTPTGLRPVPITVGAFAAGLGGS